MERGEFGYYKEDSDGSGGLWPAAVDDDEGTQVKALNEMLGDYFTEK